MKSNFNTIIFDWSGTLSDDRQPVYEANRRIFGKYGIHLNSFEKWLTTTNGSILSYFRSLGLEDHAEEVISSYKTAYTQVVKDGIVPHRYTDALSVISSLKDKEKTLAIVSSHPQFNLEEEAARYKMKEFFQIIKGDSLDKPSHIVQMIEEIQCSPQSTIYIGDMVQDIEAASKAGISCATVCTGYHSKERLEEAKPSLGVFDNLTELLKVLE